jgi:cysteine desulfurase
VESGQRVVTPEALIFGAAAPRLPNTTLFTAPGLKAETAVIAFDLNGIAVSSGAACSSGKVQPSAVLTAMGFEPALARGAVRVSLGWSTTEIEVEQFLGTWIRLSASLLKERRGLAA